MNGADSPREIEQSQSIEKPRERTRFATWLGVGLVVLFAAIYFFTLDNGLAPEELHGGDLITHQYAQVQGRPGNAPGYPLYTVGGWLWYRSLRAFAADDANPIPILSSYSTAWALLSLWLLYQIVRFVTSTRYRARSERGYGGNWLLALLIATFYGVTYFFWYYATTTEQYSSAIAQTLAIFYIYLLWSEAAGELSRAKTQSQRAQREQGNAEKSGVGEKFGEKTDASTGIGAEVESGSRDVTWGRAEWLLIAMAFLCGVSLSHMLTVAFIVPPLVAVILWQRPDYLRRGWLILACVLAAVLPLVSYTYVYVRGAAHPEWWGRFPYASAQEWFWAFVSTDQGRRELGWGAGAAFTWTGNGFPALIWQELSVPLLVIGLIGIAFLQWRSAWLIFGTTLIYVVFCWVYRYGNWFQVILPLYPLILVGVAAAVERLLQWKPFQKSRALAALPYALLLIAVVWRAAESLPAANSRNRAGDTALDRAAVLLGTAPSGSALFAAVDDTLALNYLLEIWGLDSGSELVSSNNADAAARERPLLSTWEAALTLLAEIDAGEWRVASVSPDWVQVLATGEMPIEPFAESGIPFEPVAIGDGAVQLVGVISKVESAGAPVTTAAPPLSVALEWNVPGGAWPTNLAYSVRPTVGGEYVQFEDGSISQRDSRQPLGDLYAYALDPTALREVMRLPLDGESNETIDGLTVIFYNPENGEVIQEVEVPFNGPPQMEIVDD